MPESAVLPEALDLERLRDWLIHQRWFASKSREVTSVEIIEQLPLGDGFVLALAQAYFPTGVHELYQLPLAVRDSSVTFDALDTPELARKLYAQIEAGEDLETAEGRFSFRRMLEGGAPVDGDLSVRALGGEQSNSSIVLGEQIVIKVFRKLEAGINPELELLRFLMAHGFGAIAPLHGWFEYEGTALAGTLGVSERLIADGRDGWELALAEIPSAPDVFLERVAGLGACTARLHSALASDATDPAFSPEEPSAEAIALLTATIDEDIERIFLHLPRDERLEPIAGRGQDVRERLAARAQVGIGGRQIRIHGDYHLGQTLVTPNGWVILDFEGEPARPLPERRQKRSPLRDVASMLRSFAYAVSAVALLRGQRAPDGYEGRLRAAFLEQYFAEIDPALMPAGEWAVISMLSVFELEKAIYELRYELDHRPNWVSIPVAGIERLLEAPG